MVMESQRYGANGRNRLLGALGVADFSLLAPHLRDVSLAQGEVLQEPGEPFTQVYFPKAGMISLLAVMQNGTAVETATVGREGAVGASAGLGSRTIRWLQRRCILLKLASADGCSKRGIATMATTCR
jgi:CRP-like cAMP-binding protein